MTKLQRVVVLLFLLFQLTSPFPFRTPAKLKKIGGLSSSSTRRSDKSKDATTSTTAAEKKDIILVVSPKWARFLYCLSAFNPFLAVFFNDYTRMLEPFPKIYRTQSHNIILKTVEGVFTVVRLRPRVSFAIGALLRALQLTTAFQYVINPPVGVGFGLNVICLLANSRWPATIFLGWSLTEPLWKILGARAPSSSPVPITINFTKSKAKAADTSEDNNQQPPNQTGYRIGL